MTVIVLATLAPLLLPGTGVLRAVLSAASRPASPSSLPAMAKFRACIRDSQHHYVGMSFARRSGVPLAQTHRTDASHARHASALQSFQGCVGVSCAGYFSCAGYCISTQAGWTHRPWMASVPQTFIVAPLSALQTLRISSILFGAPANPKYARQVAKAL